MENKTKSWLVFCCDCDEEFYDVTDDDDEPGCRPECGGTNIDVKEEGE